jgi:hypothetical protein
MTKSMLNIKKVNVGLYLKWKSAGYKQNKSFIFFRISKASFTNPLTRKSGVQKLSSSSIIIHNV